MQAARQNTGSFTGIVAGWLLRLKTRVAMGHRWRYGRRDASTLGLEGIVAVFRTAGDQRSLWACRPGRFHAGQRSPLRSLAPRWPSSTTPKPAWCAAPTTLCDPTRPSTNADHVRLTSPSDTAVSVWPLADPLLDWEVRHDQ